MASRLFTTGLATFSLTDLLNCTQLFLIPVPVVHHWFVNNYQSLTLKEKSMKTLNKALFGTALFLATAYAMAEDGTVTTRYGTLSIENKEPYAAKLLFNNKKVFDKGSYTLSIEKRFQLDEQDVVLVSHSEGGNACPAQYFFVALKQNKQPTLSPLFGTCSDLVKVKQEGGSVIVTMPKMSGKGNAKYVFKDGVVLENGKPIKASS